MIQIICSTVVHVISLSPTTLYVSYATQMHTLLFVCIIDAHTIDDQFSCSSMHFRATCCWCAPGAESQTIWAHSKHQPSQIHNTQHKPATNKPDPQIQTHDRHSNAAAASTMDVA